MNMSAVAFSIASGLFAAFSSLFGKLITLDLENEKVQQFLEVYFIIVAKTEMPSESSFQEIYRWIHLAALVLYILVNLGMWWCFVQALKTASSTVEVTAVNMATNFICTGILGRLLFDETGGLVWWSGIGCILAGVILIERSKHSEKKRV